MREYLRTLSWTVALVGALALNGCSTLATSRSTATRPFDFSNDTFSYANELVWEYQFDPLTGKTTTKRYEPPAQYTLHCFVMARVARQFFQHAVFDGARAKADEKTYRRLVRQVVSANPRRTSKQIVLPGYANLREFSQAEEALLKAECGGAWRSYFQRGHWRMIFPFSRGHQEQTAGALVQSVRKNIPPVVHIVRFPQLTINHAMLVFDYIHRGDHIEFLAYDPNDPDKPVTLRYQRRTRTFEMERNRYFQGGRVEVYEVYHRMNY